MITRSKIPVIDANITDVTITRWLCREGDAVKKNQPIAEMTTEKAAFEFVAIRSGVLRAILAPEKSVVPIGYIVCLIGDAADPLPDVSGHNAAVMEHYRAAAGAKQNAPAPSRVAAPVGAAVRATPAARRLAKELGVDLAAAQARSPGTIIDGAAVRRFAEEQKR